MLSTSSSVASTPSRFRRADCRRFVGAAALLRFCSRPAVLLSVPGASATGKEEAEDAASASASIMELGEPVKGDATGVPVAGGEVRAARSLGVTAADGRREDVWLATGPLPAACGGATAGPGAGAGGSAGAGVATAEAITGGAALDVGNVPL